MRKKLWQPSATRSADSQMNQFRLFVNNSLNKNFQDYNQLWQWSVTDIAQFWEVYFNYSGIIHCGNVSRVIDDESKMPGAQWFDGITLNYAENLLTRRDDESSIIFYGEDHVKQTLSYNQLYLSVAQTAAGLKAAGVSPGDRVAGFMPNMPETGIAMLAAVWLQ